MVQTNAIERVEECEAALNLVSFNHSLKDLADCDRFSFPSEVVGDRQDGTQVVRRMAPLI